MKFFIALFVISALWQLSLYKEEQRRSGRLLVEYYKNGKKVHEWTDNNNETWFSNVYKSISTPDGNVLSVDSITIKSIQ